MKRLAICTLMGAMSLFAGDPAKSKAKDEAAKLPAVIWAAPSDIPSRDLFYGAGGESHAPNVSAAYTFVEEDRDGNSPKFVVEDSQGVKWKVKVGEEARAETAATRLVWAAGYLTDEDYFIPAMKINNMPRRLHRGGEQVSPDGIVYNARWERMDHKKAGEWKWRSNPFYKTRELNGLRVLMSLLGNYDLKDSQNSIYVDSQSAEYVVSDLGATLGTTGSRWPRASSKGELKEYSKSDFIKKVTPTYVDFAAPSWPMLLGFLPTPPLPYSWITQPMRLAGRPASPNFTAQRWIGKQIPREDAKWIGELLGKLSAKQIRDAFRAAYFSPEEVEGFSRVIERRIALLGEL